MIQTFLALAPIFLLIAVGWAAKALWLRDDSLWRPIEQLAYYLLIPAFVVHDLYNADLASLPFSRMVIALLGAVLIVAALLIIGSVPFFFGLAVVMPVLGHATWHLYRKVVQA